MPPSKAQAAAIAIALASTTVGAGARADNLKEQCATTSEDAQRLRTDGKLVEAKQALVSCARSECPRIVREACDRWLTEVDASLPSILITARDREGDRVDVRVLIDGTPLLERLTGLPVPVNPGSHVLRFEAPHARTIEQALLILSGDKSRVIAVSLEEPVAMPTPPVPPVVPLVPAPRAHRPVPASVFVLGGTGVAAFAGSAVLIALARSDEESMRATCAPACSSSRYDAFNDKVIGADVALGVGIVAAGVAAILLWKRPVRTETAGELHLSPVGQGALFGATF